MGIRAVEQGATGRHVAAEIKRLRLHHRWTLKVVSDALSGYGRPLLPSGVSKIEEGERRVDVDDLVAFAQVFEVSPLYLLGWHDDHDSDPAPTAIGDQLREILTRLAAVEAKNG